jgi:hypothetical protein
LDTSADAVAPFVARASGNISTDVTITADSSGAVFNTGTLAAGTWLVSINATVTASTTGATGAIQAQVGGGGSLYGGYAAQFKFSGANGVTNVAITFLATLTTNGPVYLAAGATSTGDIVFKANVSTGLSTTNTTGWTAIQIA